MSKIEVGQWYELITEENSLTKGRRYQVLRTDTDGDGVVENDYGGRWYINPTNIERNHWKLIEDATITEEKYRRVADSEIRLFTPGNIYNAIRESGDPDEVTVMGNDGKDYRIASFDANYWKLVEDKVHEIKVGQFDGKLSSNWEYIEGEEEQQVTSDGGRSDYWDIPTFAKELHHLMEHKKMNANVANIFKACYRLGEKSGTDERYDLNKIARFTECELERLDREGNTSD